MNFIRFDFLQTYRKLMEITNQNLKKEKKQKKLKIHENL